MSILPIVVQYLGFLNNINAHIQSYHGYPYSSIKDNMMTWIIEESWEITENIPDAKQVKKCPTTSVCKICTYVQNEINQTDEIFDCPPYMNISFPRHFFINNLYLMCQLLKKG